MPGEAKTAVREGVPLRGAYPACSSAPQATCMKSRCCGSMRRASWGEMPKKVASKYCAPCTMYAAGTKLGWSRTAAGTPLAASVGWSKSVSASLPAASISQKASTSPAPGNIPATPTMASRRSDDDGCPGEPAGKATARGDASSDEAEGAGGGASSTASERTVGASKRSSTVSDLGSAVETAATSLEAVSEWPPRSKKLSSGATSSTSSTSAQIAASSASSAAPVGIGMPAGSAGVGAARRGAASASFGLGSALRSSFFASPPPSASCREIIQWCGTACGGSSPRAASRSAASHALASAAAAASATSPGSTCATSATGWPVTSSSNATTAARATPGSAPSAAST